MADGTQPSPPTGITLQQKATSPKLHPLLRAVPVSSYRLIGRHGASVCLSVGQFLKGHFRSRAHQATIPSPHHSSSALTGAVSAVPVSPGRLSRRCSESVSWGTGLTTGCGLEENLSVPGYLAEAACDAIQ